MYSVFPSYVYEDKEAKATLVEWAEAGRLGPVKVTGEKEDVRFAGAGAIKKHLSPLLKGCAAVVVLVGQDTHNHDWVDYEVQHALSHHKPIIPVRLPGTTGAAPRALRRAQELPFEPDAIRRALGFYFRGVL